VDFPTLYPCSTVLPFARTSTLSPTCLFRRRPHPRASFLWGRNQNPGLARRFNASLPIRFEDYNDNELAIIATAECAKLGLDMPLAVKQHMVKQLRRLRALPNFGNAGAVHTMLSDAKARMAVRVQGSDRPMGARPCLQVRAQLCAQIPVWVEPSKTFDVVSCVRLPAGGGL
jgi:hypothetical protein